MVMTAAPTTTTTNNAGGRLVSTDGRELPLQSVHIAAEAGGGIARTRLTQRFRNPFNEPLEVRYLLPLPSDGAVSGFSFVLGDERVVGEVTTKQQARERFERALVQGKTAALLEQDRTSLFTQRVGNVPPRTEIIAEVVVDQPLRWLDEGSWEWRFPTVVGPRYQGAPGRVPDAAKLSVPVADGSVGVRATLILSIADSLTGAARSSSHGIESRSLRTTTETEVRLESAARLDRDVVISWPVALPEVSARAIAARPNTAAHDGDTFALLTVAPPTAGGVAVPRDLTFLIDTSGSMGGEPLNQCKRVVMSMLATLGVQDRIEMIEFGSSPRRWKKQPVPATESNKDEALAWLRALGARGSTEMHRAVLEALRPLRDGSQRQVVLLTDGYIGFEKEIVTTLLTDLPAGARLHTVGVGSSINRSLTQAAARAGRGTELIIGVGEDADAVVGRLLARTSAPLVTDLVLKGRGVIEVAPRQLPDLYAEAPALIAVRTAGGGEVILRGRTAEGPFEQRLTVPALERGQGLAGIATLFAREKVEDLETSLTAGRSAREVDESIETTGIAFQIATRLTSWVAVSKQVTVDARAQARTVEQPHELPHGVSAEGLGLRQASGLVQQQQSLGGRLAASAASAFAPRKRMAERQRPASPPPAARAPMSKEEKPSGSFKAPMDMPAPAEQEDLLFDAFDSGDDLILEDSTLDAALPVSVPSISEDRGLVEIDADAALVEVGSGEWAETEAFELMDEGEDDAKYRRRDEDMNRLTRTGAALGFDAREHMKRLQAQHAEKARAAKTSRLRWLLLVLFVAALAIVALWLAGVINLGG